MDALLALSFGGKLIYSALSVLLGVCIYGGLLIVTKTAKNNLSLMVHNKNQ